MKFGLFTAALSALLAPTCRALPSPDPLQLELSVDIHEKAPDAPGLALLVFLSPDLEFNGLSYHVTTTVDGKEFFTHQPTIEVGSITVNGRAICTVCDINDKCYICPSAGPPNTTFIDPAVVMVNGSCVPPPPQEVSAYLGL